MQKLHQLEEKLHKRLHGQWYGQLESMFSGEGIEVDEMRQRQQGDSQRTINRKLTAKFDELWINTYESVQGARVDMLLDCNSNRYAGIERPNREQVVDFLTDYALFAKKQGLQTTVRSGLSGDLRKQSMDGFGDRRSLVAELAQGSRKHTYESKLLPWMSQQLINKKQRILIIISDFLTDDYIWEPLLISAEKKHIVITMRIPVPTIVGSNFLG